MDDRLWAASRAQHVNRAVNTAMKRSSVMQPLSAPTSSQEFSRPKSCRNPHGGVHCAYCKATFSSEERREEHVQSEHIADEQDSEAKQLLKPLIRRNGIVFEQKKYRRVAIPANRVESPGPAQQPEIGLQLGLRQPLPIDVAEGDQREDQLGPDNYREARRLDGSRDGWKIRDNGQFGSYPSFDACDDESAP
jgi:hypothetical protein